MENCVIDDAIGAEKMNYEDFCHIASNGGYTRFTVTFSQYVSVHNPDCAAFSHYNSTLQLIYSSSQVGLMFLPASKIEEGQTQFMAVNFTAQSFPISDPNRASRMVQNPPGPTF
ncbi:hypothetical protein COP2_007675 [Malus domestica]